MPNYYTIDLIKEPSGSYKFIDFHGTPGGGLPLIQSTYGNIDRLKRYVEILNELAGNKLIIYREGGFSHGLSFIPENDIIRNFANIHPTTYWVNDQLQYQQRNRTRKTYDFKKTQHFLHKAVRDLRESGINVNILFCDDFREEDGLYIAEGARDTPDRNKKDIPLKPSDIGLYFQHGDVHYPEFLLGNSLFPVIDNPFIDQAFSNKLFIRYFLQNTEFEELLPEYVYVGMGMNSKKTINDFLKGCSDSEQSVVLKPILGMRGVGIKFLGKQDVVQMFELDEPQKDYDLKELESMINEDTIPLRWKDLASIDETFMMEDLAVGSGLFGLSDGFVDFLEVGLGKGREDFFRAIKLSGKSDDIAVHMHLSHPKYQIHPVIYHYISILEKYVEPELRQSQQGTYHQGYIRLLILDKKIIAGLYRSPQESYDGEFINLNEPNVRTTFEPMDEKTEAELSDIVQGLIPKFEERFNREVSSFEDLKKIREKIVIGNLRQAYEEVFNTA